MDGDHSLEGGLGVAAGIEENVDGTIKLGGGTVEHVAEVSCLEAFEGLEEAEETGAGAGGRHGMDVDTSFREKVADVVGVGRGLGGSGGVVEETAIEDGLGDACRFGFALFDTVAQPALMRGGDARLHQPLLIAVGVEEVHFVHILLAARIAGRLKDTNSTTSHTPALPW